MKHPLPERKNTFADPTYNVMFSKLFGVTKNQRIIISLISSLLDISNIESVEIITPMLETEVKGSLSAAVDILCKLSTGHYVIVEMQGVRKDYFLARSQYYMAKIIASQMKSGESTLYHKKISKTYELIIGRDYLFSNKELGLEPAASDTTYVKTVEPWILDYNVPFPNNKMCWKVYELAKFRYQKMDGKVDMSSITSQWLDFLANCSSYDKQPHSISDVISDAYKIMELHNLEQDEKLAYDTALMAEEKEGEVDVEFYKEIIEQETAQAEERGEKRGDIKGVIKKVQDFFDLEIPKEKIITKLDDVNELFCNHVDLVKEVFEQQKQNYYDVLCFLDDDIFPDIDFGTKKMIKPSDDHENDTFEGGDY